MQQMLFARQNAASAPFVSRFRNELFDELGGVAATTETRKHIEPENRGPISRRVVFRRIRKQIVADRFLVRHHTVNKTHGLAVGFENPEMIPVRRETLGKLVAGCRFRRRKARRFNRRNEIQVRCVRPAEHEIFRHRHTLTQTSAPVRAS